MNKRILKRFIEKIDFTDTCWLWKAGKFKNGYAQFWLDDGNFSGQKYAHRVSFSWFVSPLQRKMDIHHICNTKHCVNPAHLILITRSEHLLEDIKNGVRVTKTHCKQGHSLSGDNLYISKKQRVCKTCRAKRLREFKKRKRVANAVIKLAVVA